MLWRQLLFVVFSIVMLAGCGIQSVEEYERLEETERSVEVERKPEVVEEPVAEQVEEKSVPPKEVIKEEPKPEATPKQEEPKAEVKPAPKVEVKAEQPVEVKQEPKAEVKVAPAPKAEPTPQVKTESVKQEPAKEEPAPVPQKRTVTIAIYVHNLVANMDQLHPSLKSEKYVPASGVVLAPVTYELLSDKDTVWDVLRRAAKEHNIQLEYEGADENIYDSVYIEGIHHLYEFSAGPLSGWMYSVNGDFPNVGASQQKLADGDIIEWHYTLDLGRDLGEDV